MTRLEQHQKACEELETIGIPFNPIWSVEDLDLLLQQHHKVFKPTVSQALTGFEQILNEVCLMYKPRLRESVMADLEKFKKSLANKKII